MIRFYRNADLKKTTENPNDILKDVKTDNKSDIK